MKSCSPEALRSPAGWPARARSGPPARLRQQGDTKPDVREEPTSPAKGDKRPARKPGDKQGGAVSAEGQREELRAHGCSGRSVPEAGSVVRSDRFCPVSYTGVQGGGSANPEQRSERSPADHDACPPTPLTEGKWGPGRSPGLMSSSPLLGQLCPPEAGSWVPTGGLGGGHGDTTQSQVAADRKQTEGQSTAPGRGRGPRAAHVTQSSEAGGSDELHELAVAHVPQQALQAALACEREGAQSPPRARARPPGALALPSA